jgi:hypothetical protein
MGEDFGLTTAKTLPATTEFPKPTFISLLSILRPQKIMLLYPLQADTWHLPEEQKTL